MKSWTQKAQPISLIWRFMVVYRNSSIIVPNNLSQDTMMIHSIISYVSHSFICQPLPRYTLHTDFQSSLASGEDSKRWEVGWNVIKIFISMAPHLQSYCFSVDTHTHTHAILYKQILTIIFCLVLYLNCFELVYKSMTISFNQVKCLPFLQCFTVWDKEEILSSYLVNGVTTNYLQYFQALFTKANPVSFSIWSHWRFHIISMTFVAI